MNGVTPLPKRCEGCGTAWRTMFDVFVNGLGWQRRCAGCANPPDRGPPRAYTGPYPITRRTRCGHLSVVPGDAA